MSKNSPVRRVKKLPEFIQFDGKRISTYDFMLKPCQTKEALHRWIRVFLGLDIPDCIVCEESTASPMDMIWNVYRAALEGDADESSQLYFASRDSFKCVDKNSTYLLTPKGPRLACDVKIGDSVYNGTDWVEVTGVYDEGVIDTVSVGLSNGLKMTGSIRHMIRVAESDGNKWRPIRALKNDDNVVCTLPALPNAEIDYDQMEFGYIVGLLTGDGWLTGMHRYRRIGWTESDSCVVGIVISFVERNGGSVVRSWSRKNPYDYTITGINVISRLRPFLVEKKSPTRRISPLLMESSISTKIGFLSGYFDSDGTFSSSKKEVSFVTTSPSMADDTIALLWSLGIYSQKIPCKYSGFGKMGVRYRVVVNGSHLQNLIAIGFTSFKISSPRSKINRIDPAAFRNARPVPIELVRAELIRTRDELKRKLLNLRGGNFKAKGVTLSTHNYSPSFLRSWTTYPYKGISQKKIHDFVSFAEKFVEVPEALRFWANDRNMVLTVTSGPDFGSADCVDFTVSDGSAYATNGVVSHNTMNAAICELLMMLHFNRTASHMGAIKPQAKKCYDYVKKFLRRELLSEIPTERDTMERTELILDNPWDINPYLQIIVCTLQGANCIDDESMISMGDGSFKVAKDIVRGDVVMVFDPRLCRWIGMPVRTTFYSEPKLAIRIVLDNGSSQVLSEDHPVYTERGYRRAASLFRGDIIHVDRSISGIKSESLRPSLRGIKAPPLFNAKDTACIVCGKGVDRARRRGFSYCSSDCQYSWTRTEAGSSKRATLLSHIEANSARIESIEPLGFRDNLIDITIDTSDLLLKNFVSNGIHLKNSEHTNVHVVDEIDTVTDVQAYQESKKIPTETLPIIDPVTGNIVEDKKPSITLYISTRKSSFGLVQREVDRASESGLRVRSWNIIDVTRACPDEKSRRLEGHVQLYYNVDKLQLIGPEQYGQLDPVARMDWTPKQMYPGCVQCKIAPLCVGRLATRQRSRSPMLKTHREVEKKYAESELSDAVAQLMCLKPSLKGIVFTGFDERKSIVTPTQMWEQFMYGDFDRRKPEQRAPHQISFDELIRTFHAHGVPSYGGQDWGFVHPAVSLAMFIDKSDNIYVVDEFAVTDMSDPEVIDHVNSARDGCLNWQQYYRIVRWYCDTAQPGSIKIMKNSGIPVADKVDKDIHPGVQTLKRLMRVPATGRTKLFILKRSQDAQIGSAKGRWGGCSLLIDHIKTFHLKMNSSGLIIANDLYADKFDDAVDALRYPVQTLLGKRSGEVHVGAPMNVDPSFTAEGAFRKADKRPPNPIELAQQMGVPIIDNREVFFNDDGSIKSAEEIEAYLGNVEPSAPAQPRSSGNKFEWF